MNVAIQATHKVGCQLYDFWRCLIGRRVSESHVVLVTFEDGTQELFASDQLTEEYFVSHPNGAKRLAQWQLLMFPIGDGPEVQYETLLDLVRRRDFILTSLAQTTRRDVKVVRELKADLSEIESRLASLPNTVFKDFREVAALRSRAERLEVALKEYKARTNWNPVDEKQQTWMWTGIGTQCERISEPWGLAEDALKED